MNISDQVRRGIKIMCAKNDTSIPKAAYDSGVPKSAIYRFTSGKHDIKMVKLDTFCRLGLGVSLETLLRVGRDGTD